MVEEAEVSAPALGARNEHQGTGGSERIVEAERTHLRGIPGGRAGSPYHSADAATRGSGSAPTKGLDFCGRILRTDTIMKPFPTWVGIEMVGDLKQIGWVGGREPGAYDEEENQAAFHKFRVRPILPVLSM